MNRCPTCDVPLRSNLSACRTPACLAEEIRIDKLHERGDDQ